MLIFMASKTMRVFVVYSAGIYNEPTKYMELYDYINSTKLLDIDRNFV